VTLDEGLAIQNDALPVECFSAYCFILEFSIADGSERGWRQVSLASHPRFAGAILATRDGAALIRTNYWQRGIGWN